MSNVSDLSIEVLKDIRSELRALNERVEIGFASVNERVDVLTHRVDALTHRVDTGFAEVNRRLDARITSA